MSHARSDSNQTDCKQSAPPKFAPRQPDTFVENEPCRRRSLKTKTPHCGNNALRDLESLKQEGSGAYPPKLAELARLSGQSPSDEQVQKAANKKTFTAKAVVIEKVNKKPSLDSPVYIKGTSRKPKPDEKLAERMVWFWNHNDGWEPRLIRRSCGNRRAVRIDSLERLGHQGHKP